jgi:hypothetical protein
VATSGYFLTTSRVEEKGIARGFSAALAGGHQNAGVKFGCRS